MCLKTINKYVCFLRKAPVHIQGKLYQNASELPTSITEALEKKRLHQSCEDMNNMKILSQMKSNFRSIKSGKSVVPSETKINQRSFSVNMV